MNIFKKKQNPKKELSTVEFSKDILLDVDLSTPTIPGYPISSYYGQPIAFLSSGTYDELYEWLPPSGTVYEYNELLDPKFNIALRGEKFDLKFMTCSYCKSKILLNKEFAKMALTSLSCPNCGGRLE